MSPMRRQSLRTRLSWLEGQVQGSVEAGALGDVRRFMEFVWGPGWPEHLLQLTAALCPGGDDACWACEVVKWFGYREYRAGDPRSRAGAERKAETWLAALERGSTEPERQLPMMSPFFGVDLSAEWRKLKSLETGGPGS